MTHTLVGWIGNKADSPTIIEITDKLAAEFMASPRYDPEGPLFSAIVAWVAEESGRNLAWDPDVESNRDALDELYVKVRAAEKGEGRR